MKDVFDHAIQYARDQDPGFVKSYKWPEQSASTEHVSPDYSSIRTRETTSGFFPSDWEDTGNILVTSFEGLQLPEEEANDNNYGDDGNDGDGGDTNYDEDADGNDYNPNNRYPGYSVYDHRDAYKYPSRYIDKSGYPSFDPEEDDYHMFGLPLKYLDYGEIKHPEDDY
ncbi:hypothetical protein MFLAVUS_005764 [Mucor flavus]|uniref:Uncharacterized protein n=1 Tax=Mucor flavus TaxID=439312 RepID=A0ABP9YZP6_9FUNG